MDKTENKFFNSDRIVKYLGIEKKARRKNEELKDFLRLFYSKYQVKK